MFVLNFEKYHDIIHINASKFKWFQYSVDLFLYVYRRVSVTHRDYFERFLFAMWDNCELMTIIRMNTSLIEKTDTVYNRDELTFLNDLNNIILQWQKICIRLKYCIQLSDVDNDTSFLVARRIASDHKHWKTKERILFCSF